MCGLERRDFVCKVTSTVRVRDELQHAILEGVLRPGERLRAEALAQRFGTSRTPVREALLQLADEDLVEIYPQSGTFVSRISVHGVTEAQFIREALECAALRRGLEQFGEADLRRLEQNLERQRDAYAAHDFDTFYILDEAFHQALVERSGFPGVWRIAQRAKVHLNRARRLSLPAVSTIGELIEQHAGIAARVAAGDGPAAEAALAEHLRMVLADLPAIQREYPDYVTNGEEAPARPPTEMSR